ncbi:hypothetical protein [Stenotrophomonas sp. MMGLT7]|uniref:hypothetical protein n=1 Tax=Stenotrophomonas sp. MMGLT7 TaxID=2901227 RepID=UPI001E47FFC5|nr:hypothetical protein [Stenotrophomonas sp. MMGLT7]MCD7096968.1 hypothetical protein [Stenotrophomonas sp. MMGLT7]
MEGFFGLAAFVFAWVVMAHLGKKKNWGGLKWHGLGFVAALVALGIVGAVLAPPSNPAQPTPATQATDEAADPVDVRPQGADDKALKKLDDRLVSVDHMPMATPPRLVLTLKGDGWDEAAVFQNFAMDARRLLTKMGERKLLPADEDITFILRVGTVGGDGRDAEQNIVHLTLPATAATQVAGTDNKNAESELLRHARAEFNGRMGREVVTAFCNSDRSQMVVPAATFCQQALGRDGAG